MAAKNTKRKPSTPDKKAVRSDDLSMLDKLNEVENMLKSVPLFAIPYSITDREQMMIYIQIKTKEWLTGTAINSLSTLQKSLQEKILENNKNG